MGSLLLFMTAAFLLSFPDSGTSIAVRGDVPQETGSDGQHNRPVCVTDFFPDDYVSDGSVSYQAQIQEAIDTAANTDRSLVFPPLTYQLDDPAGLTLHSDTTLDLRGAVFRFAETCEADGQAFLGRDVAGVRFLGGRIVGRREAWSEGVNIAGIRIVGDSEQIRVRGTTFHDLSSNGVGMFGEEEQPIADVWIEDIVTRNCCNVYRDYLQPDSGPAEGSERKDQGNVALYHVRNFTVTGCSLEGSRSDGTHFYKCRDGRFTENRVVDSQMGGYFIETCRNVLAADNLIRGNGSRGVTIERNSFFCTLRGNIVEHSGREGLWAPDVVGCLVSGNIFRENGRKDHEGRDAEIKVEEREKWDAQTRDFRIEGNLFYTTAHQETAIHVTGGCESIVVQSNTFRGPAERLRP